MILDPHMLSKRDKLIIAGLYLAKFDLIGLGKLGFESFVEGVNVIGYALGSKPASIKNYRDEFDPLFPNPRLGWHKRARREYCLKIYEEYRELDLDTFASLITSFIGFDERLAASSEGGFLKDETESAFAKRLITGVAAENYFQAIQPTLPEFQGLTAENTTRLGCGFDFRLPYAGTGGYFAVEVKGLAERFGNVSLTQKEHEVAESLAESYFLFVVRNFRESPNHVMYRNPLSGGLRFSRKERVTIQVSWLATIGNNHSK